MSSTPHADDRPETPTLSAPAPSGTSTAQRPPLRVLDKAPTHLRTAAMIVVAGSVLPWMPGKVEVGAGNAWLPTLLSKAVMGVAAWLWMQQVQHNFGPRLGGVLAQLADLHLKPKAKASEDEDGKARRARPKTPTAHLEHPFPTGLHLLSLILVIASLIVATRDPRAGLISSNGVAEVAMLGWAAFTWVHIASYERWGSFNPLFPLMFLGMLVAGVLAVLGAVTSAELAGASKLMALLGGTGVAAGGGLAAFTIVEAMMQAKREGDRKKAEALEARKAARQKKA